MFPIPVFESLTFLGPVFLKVGLRSAILSFWMHASSALRTSATLPTLRHLCQFPRREAGHPLCRARTCVGLWSTCSAVLGVSLPALHHRDFPWTFLGSPRSQTYFHNNSGTLFAYSILLTSALVMAKRLAPCTDQGRGTEVSRSHCVLPRHTLVLKHAPISLKNILKEEVKGLAL